MVVSLATNIASLSAQRRLTSSSDNLSRIYNRLSSGQRINRAVDDAAGLAIADSLRTDAHLQSVAVRNINDGISLLNIAETALDAQVSIVIRLAELAQQGANGVLGDDQRAALNNEYQALVDEYGRIANSSEFNTITVVDGSSPDISMQVGIDGGSTSGVEIETISSALDRGVLGLRGDLTGEGTVDFADFTSYNNATTVPQSFEDLALLVGNAIQTRKVVDSDNQERTIYITHALYEFSGGTSTVVGVFSDVGLGGLSSVAPGITINPPYEGSSSLTFSDTGATATVEHDFSDYQFENLGSGTLLQLNGDVEVRKTAIDFTGVETVGRAQDAIDTTTNLLEDLVGLKGQVGAAQSRFTVAANVAAVSRENIVAAESQIRDADVAKEAADLVRYQILRQASVAVLAQANQQSEIALTLISAA